jgi:signal peptidase I
VSDELYDGPTSLGEPVPPPGAYGRGYAFARIVIVPLALIFLTIVLFFYALFGFSRVVGLSMVPNFLPEDRILLTHGYTDPRRGDVVVLRVTGQDGKPEEVVKRVVALPGDRVEIRDDWAIVNGMTEGGYRVFRVKGEGVYLAEQRVPSGDIYVLGDNRPVSYDSRFIGPQPVSAVRGRAVAIFMPITRIQAVKRLPR